MWGEDLDKPGIYQIRNVETGKVYIGSSKSIVWRWNKHLTDLDCGKHHSPYLQRSWGKRGACDFMFEVLMFCDESRRYQMEQYFIDMTRADVYGYNGLALAGTARNHRWTDEQRARLSERMRAAYAGRVLSDEERERMSGTSKAAWARRKRSKAYKEEQEMKAREKAKSMQEIEARASARRKAVRIERIGSGEVVVLPSRRAAAEYIGCCTKQIRDVIVGKQMSTHGFFVNEA